MTDSTSPTSDPSAGDLAALERRIARLEAIEAVRYAFNRYLHAVDNNRVDVLVGEVFTEDVEVVIANYPPGSGKNHLLHGSDAVRSIYEPVRAGGQRHNAANTSVVVADDLGEAHLTSYFVTTLAWGNQGGMYEATFVPTGDGTWKAKRWLVSSQWGWKLTDTDLELPDPYLSDPPSVGTGHDGMQPR
jgi:hypothetical protein